MHELCQPEESVDKRLRSTTDAAGTHLHNEWSKLHRLHKSLCSLLLQKNGENSFLDLSVIYSVEKEKLAQMREFSGGKLKIRGGVSPGANCERGGCTNYFAGDNRSNQTSALMIMHSMFFHVHNYLADGLLEVNAHWDDQRLFSEARELTISIYQSLVYNYWLPVYLGLCLCPFPSVQRRLTLIDFAQVRIF